MGHIKDRETAQDHAIYLRRVKAIELRVKGRKTMRQIAEELGVSLGTASNDIHWMLAHESEKTPDQVASARDIENRRLDEWLAKTMLAIDEATDVDDLTKLLGTVLKISERRAKLLGLDAPIKQEIETTLAGEVTPATARALMRQHFASGVEPGGADDDQPN